MVGNAGPGGQDGTSGAGSAETTGLAPPMKPIDLAVAAACERAERLAWADFCRAATGAVATACGVGLTEIAGATAGRATRVDILAFNRAVGLGMDQAATPAALDGVFEFFAETERFFVQVSPTAQPPALAEWLISRGMRHHNNWVKLFRNAREPLRLTPVPGVRVEPIGPASAPAAATLVGDAFGFPEALRTWWSAAIGRPGWIHYLAYIDDQPIGTAAMYVTGELAWLGWAATREDARCKGAQSDLILRRMADAASAGCRWLVVETAEDNPEEPNPSTRNLRRLGFQFAYLRPNYIWARERSP